MEQEKPTQTQLTSVVPPVITIPPQAFEPPPTPPPSQFPTPQAKRLDQIKALGWILALISAIFIILVVTAISLNFSGGPKTGMFFTTPRPASTPPISSPVPTPPIPESKFNITP